MANKDATKKRASFKEYFKSVRVEMKKVVWPTKKETISYTAVVIATCAVFALGFGLSTQAFWLHLRQFLTSLCRTRRRLEILILLLK